MPTNVKQAVPFLSVSDMKQSVHFYVDALQFQITKKWIVAGQLRWCWLEIGDAAIMLQEFRKQGLNAWVPESKVGIGVSICFQCEDALAIYRDAVARGLPAQTPFVGNGMWVTNLSDPDGYNLSFESPTDAPEESVLSLP